MRTQGKSYSIRGGDVVLKINNSAQHFWINKKRSSEFQISQHKVKKKFNSNNNSHLKPRPWLAMSLWNILIITCIWCLKLITWLYSGILGTCTYYGHEKHSTFQLHHVCIHPYLKARFRGVANLSLSLSWDFRLTSAPSFTWHKQIQQLVLTILNSKKRIHITCGIKIMMSRYKHLVTFIAA